MTLLEGRHALVTAAASGIGLAVAERFRQEGAQVSGVDVEDGAEYRHDLRDLDGIEPLVARIEAARGPLDVLCSVAGVYGPMWAVELEPGFVSTPMSIADGRNELESEWFRSVYIENRKLPLRRLQLFGFGLIDQARYRLSRAAVRAGVVGLSFTGCAADAFSDENAIPPSSISPCAKISRNFSLAVTTATFRPAR